MTCRCESDVKGTFPVLAREQGGTVGVAAYVHCDGGGAKREKGMARFTQTDPVAAQVRDPYVGRTCT